MPKRILIPVGILLLLLILGVTWVLNYWTEKDGRVLNKQQPIAYGQMIYGGKCRVQRHKTGMALRRDFIPWRAETGTMADEAYRYYYQGIHEDQLRIEFIFTNAKGMEKIEEEFLPLSQGKTQLLIPPIPGSEESIVKTIQLTIVPGTQDIWAELV